MAEIICPQCGTRNPSDRQVCQSCQANLRLEDIQDTSDNDMPVDLEDNHSTSDSGLEEGLAEEPTERHPLKEQTDELGDEDTEDPVAESKSEAEETTSKELQSGDSIPDWLIRLADDETVDEKATTPEHSTEGDEGTQPGSSDSETEFSDWFIGGEANDFETSGEHDEINEEIASKDIETGLEPADLPDWLEAMRPVESVAPPLPLSNETDEPLESGGPLAGIWGVLRSGSGSDHESGPQGSSMVLHVSDNHRVHANLLKKMVEEEQTQPFDSAKKDSPQHHLRWIIALILFVTIIWSIITDTNEQNPVSVNLPPEVLSVYNLINNLPVGSRVLVAFEYEPGLSPELDAAAAPLVDHLLLQGTYLTLVTTSPIGPLLAERFMISTQSSHSITADFHYVNLGFIPASTAGLISFSQNPSRTLPFTINSDPAWGNADRETLPPLQGIRNVSDFALVVVIVDQPDVARAWIEQVLPYLQVGARSTPLIMVSSAQSEPLIRPYYEAIPRQVQGLVTGLPGGISYASLTDRDGLPWDYWEPFGKGLVVAALLITIGGIGAALINLYPRRRSDEGEETE